MEGDLMKNSEAISLELNKLSHLLKGINGSKRSIKAITIGIEDSNGNNYELNCGPISEVLLMCDINKFSTLAKDAKAKKDGYGGDLF